LPIKELMEKLGMYLVSFDRSEYGEGDLNPRRDVKSKELDIKELADQLDLGQKLFVLGSGWEDTLFGDASSKAHIYNQIHVNEICNSEFRFQSKAVYAALIVPTINYWWLSFPFKMSRQAFKKLIVT
jgi:hypothetical protein